MPMVNIIVEQNIINDNIVFNQQWQLVFLTILIVMPENYIKIFEIVKRHF
jgi:hypothetical protein